MISIAGVLEVGIDYDNLFYCRVRAGYSALDPYFQVFNAKRTKLVLGFMCGSQVRPVFFFA